MLSIRITAIFLVAAAFASTACAPVQRYHPAPIVPAQTAARIESRTLSDPGLKQFMEKELGHPPAVWPMTTWSPNELMLAAYYFSPQLQIARAEEEAAKAAVITAGQRPNPTLSLAPGIPSPYLFDLVMNFPVITAEKREIKVEQAKAMRDAARYQVAAAAWQVRSGLRAAALDYFLAQRRLLIAETEAKLQTQRAGYLKAQLAAGEIAKPAVDSAQLQLLNARVALSTAQGRIREAQAKLAAAIGAPLSAIEGIHYSWTSFDEPPDASQFSAAEIRRDAVLNRLDVRQRLAEYAAADAALRLELARQHPDFHLGPGYQYEENDNFFTLAFSTVLPIFSRNQGPIAEAEARRKDAGARFLAAQAGAIAQSEEALTQYHAAFADLEEARKTLEQMQNVQEPAARKAFEAGEQDRLFYNGVLLHSAAVTTSYLDVLARVQSALGQLEDAVQRPLEPGEVPPPADNSELLGKDTK
jgi:outer membrane protein, heavy metal efflux system